MTEKTLVGSSGSKSSSIALRRFDIFFLEIKQNYTFFLLQLELLNCRKELGEKFLTCIE